MKVAAIVLGLYIAGSGGLFGATTVTPVATQELSKLMQAAASGGPIIVRDVQAGADGLYFLLSQGAEGKPAKFIATVLARSGALAAQVELPVGPVYTAISPVADGSFWVSQIHQRHSELVRLTRQGQPLERVATEGVAQRVLTGSGSGTAAGLAWITDRTLKVAGANPSLVKTSNLLLSRFTTITAAADYIHLADKPSGIVTAIHRTRGDVLRKPLHGSEVEILRERNAAYARNLPSGASSSVHLVSDGASDSRGKTWLLLSPVSLREGATVLRLNSAGDREAAYLCRPATNGSSGAALIAADGEGIALVSRDGVIARYRVQ